MLRLGGVADVAKALGVSRQRLAALRERADFPDPVGIVGQTSVWDMDVIEAWQGSGLRQSSAGRPKAAIADRTLGGRFVLQGPPIGSGGFADVFRAIDKKTAGQEPDRPVAVKVLREGTVEAAAIVRFRRELRLLEQLEHPHIIRVLAHGDTHDEEGLWYAMPLAQGSLRDQLDEIARQTGPILDVMRQVCTGLSYVHDQNILHRDLKPGNILRTDDGLWAISDFGLAVDVERKSTILTSTAQGMGTEFYCAPEQRNAGRTADKRSDVFSLGKLPQHLVTGELPVASDMPQHPLRPVVEKACETVPDRRYQTATELLEAIEHALGVANTRWESPDDVAKRLLEAVRLPKPTEADLGEFMSWAGTLDETDDEDMAALSRVFPRLQPRSIRALWRQDPTAFRRIYDRYAAYVGTSGFEWAYCDVLADFGRRVVEHTDDSAILRSTAHSLACLGRAHNRWYVRDVLIGILQTIRDNEDAISAMNGLRDAGRLAVDWTFSDFSIHSLHPLLQSGISSILTGDEDTK